MPSATEGADRLAVKERPATSAIASSRPNILAALVTKTAKTPPSKRSRAGRPPSGVGRPFSENTAWLQPRHTSYGVRMLTDNAKRCACSEYPKRLIQPNAVQRSQSRRPLLPGGNRAARDFCRAAAASFSTSARSAGTAWRLPEVAQPDVAVAAPEQPSAAPAAVAQPSAAEVAAERSPAVAAAVVTARRSSAQAVVVRTRAAAVAEHSRGGAAVTASQSGGQQQAACAPPAVRLVAAWERTSPRTAACPHSMPAAEAGAEPLPASAVTPGLRPATPKALAC